MQIRLMDILADPDNPEFWPLKLKVFKEEKRERNSKPHPHDSTGLLCKFYCKKFDEMLVKNPLGDNEETLSKEELKEVTTLETCYKCIEDEIIDGILYHEEEDELKFFVIDREIPVMYPLELRDNGIEQNFINRYPEQCEEMGITKPYNAD